MSTSPTVYQTVVFLLFHRHIYMLIGSDTWQVTAKIAHYIMAGHAIVVVKDITLLFYYGNAVILTLW